MTSSFLQFVQRKEKQRVKQALKDGLTVMAKPTKILKHDPEAEYRISDVRISKGSLQGKSHTMGYWFGIRSYRTLQANGTPIYNVKG